MISRPRCRSQIPLLRFVTDITRRASAAPRGIRHGRRGGRGDRDRQRMSETSRSLGMASVAHARARVTSRPRCRAQIPLRRFVTDITRHARRPRRAASATRRTTTVAFMVGVMVTVTVVTSGRDVRARVIWRHSRVAAFDVRRSAFIPRRLSRRSRARAPQRHLCEWARTIAVGSGGGSGWVHGRSL